MICPKCNNNLSDGVMFCGNCGTNITAANNTPPPPSLDKVPPPQFNQQQQNANPYPQNPPPQFNQQQQNANPYPQNPPPQFNQQQNANPYPQNPPPQFNQQQQNGTSLPPKPNAYVEATKAASKKSLDFGKAFLSRNSNYAISEVYESPTPIWAILGSIYALITGIVLAIAPYVLIRQTLSSTYKAFSTDKDAQNEAIKEAMKVIDYSGVKLFFLGFISAILILLVFTLANYMIGKFVRKDISFKKSLNLVSLSFLPSTCAAVLFLVFLGVFRVSIDKPMDSYSAFLYVAIALISFSAVSALIFQHTHIKTLIDNASSWVFIIAQTAAALVSLILLKFIFLDGLSDNFEYMLGNMF